MCECNKIKELMKNKKWAERTVKELSCYYKSVDKDWIANHLWEKYCTDCNEEEEANFEALVENTEFSLVVMLLEDIYEDIIRKIKEQFDI